ncbi:hypothetical protein [Anaerosinus gibii]|uniref:Uncharacterized protein n=1 Tax=Selenobaculum gibii TaxID=3054208 RepID=A0A9Y2AK47_9FIRM|nr:hypothetical protein [Selenobaculum gbiensis]WIW71699.1 hypothetical protein P3F81_05195 [Selenobaculum gbiensis]
MEQIIEQVKEWEYIKQLPKELFGFQLKYDMDTIGDAYYIFTYEDAKRRRKMSVYYHEETKEYKVKTKIGLTEFCNIDFITSKLEDFEELLKTRFENSLKSIAIFDVNNLDSIVIDKKILTWKYIEKLPRIIEGFTLFINPSEPVRCINGSYIIFDYCDFEKESNFIIYYNIFRDEFFGDARINQIPEMTYTFDARELVDLEEKLDAHLIERLKEIRSRI